jgi:hypothetical protein
MMSVDDPITIIMNNAPLIDDDKPLVLEKIVTRMISADEIAKTTPSDCAE